MTRFTSKEISVILTSVSSQVCQFYFDKMFPNMVSIRHLDGNSNYSISITKTEFGFHVYSFFPSGKVKCILADKDTLSTAIKTSVRNVIHNCNI